MPGSVLKYNRDFRTPRSRGAQGETVFWQKIQPDALSSTSLFVPPVDPESDVSSVRVSVYLLSFSVGKVGRTLPVAEVG